MLCLSGFEPYSRWVPLMYTGICAKGQRRMSVIIDSKYFYVSD